MIVSHTLRKCRKALFRHFILWNLALFSLTLTINYPLTASAAQVTLAWDQNSEPAFAGYRIFSRKEAQSYEYSNPAWEGTETTCTISVPDDCTTYFIARAHDTYGNESNDSNEVCYQHKSISRGGDDDTDGGGGCFISTSFLMTFTSLFLAVRGTKT